MIPVYLGIGSNLGDRQLYINQAIDCIRNHPHMTLDAVSSIHETIAISTVEQPHFLNGALRILTHLSPHELLVETEAIEKKMGRVAKGSGEPRTLDLDILFYGDQILATDTLIIPHPLIQDRLFVLRPLSELAPEFCHPIFNESIAYLRSQLNGY